MALRTSNGLSCPWHVLYSAASLLPVRTILCNRENLVLLLGRPDVPRNRLARVANRWASGRYGCNCEPCTLPRSFLLLDAFPERNSFRTVACLGLRVYFSVNSIVGGAFQPRGWRILGFGDSYPSPNSSRFSDCVGLPGSSANPVTHKVLQAFRPSTPIRSTGYHPVGGKECNRGRETHIVHGRRLHVLGSPQ